MSNHDILYALARAALSATFVISAIRHSLYKKAALDEMESSGMPRSWVLMLGSIVIRLLGGMSVMLGFHARIGGALLVVFILPATFIVHRFWTTPPGQRVHELTEFLNNLAMMAGALFVIVSGSGKLSLDTALRHWQG